MKTPLTSQLGKWLILNTTVKVSIHLTKQLFFSRLEKKNISSGNSYLNSTSARGPVKINKIYTLHSTVSSTITP